MARSIDINDYCNNLYSEMAIMKERLGNFMSQLDAMGGKDKEKLSTHYKHLNELIHTIDWKLEIFSKECPVDWSKLGKDCESTASVPLSEEFKAKDYPSGGDAGG